VLTFFCALAATGFLISLVPHAASIFGALPLGYLICALIPGIVIVFPPAILTARIPRHRAKGSGSFCC
jgi:hypothetical protein